MFKRLGARSTKRPATWHSKTSRLITWWLIALVIAGLSHIAIPSYRWTLIHMFTLGALTNSIVLWSQHFTEKWQHSSPTATFYRVFVWRTYALNIAILLTIIGKIFAVPGAFLVGATSVSLLLAWHGVQIARQITWGKRFTHSSLAFMASAFSLAVGAILGLLVGRGHTDLLRAHLLANFGGFVGLAAMGALSVLFPAMWRTKIRWDLTKYALIVAIIGLLLAVKFYEVGVLVYAFAWTLALIGFLSCLPPVLRDPRDRISFPAVSALAAVIWLIGSLLRLADGHLPTLGLLVGFGAQLLIGTMSYLLPTTIGGGPTAVRAGLRELNRAALFRSTIINGGLLVWVFASNSWLKVAASALVCLCLAYLLVGVPRAVRAQRAAMAQRGADNAGVDKAGEPRWGQVTAGVALLCALALVFGGNTAPAPVSTPVAATGETTRIDLTMHNMHFMPSSVTVPAGNRLIITVHNNDTQIHDLVFPSGSTTGRMQPGATTELDAGIISTSTEAWCSIAGHKMQGMTLQVLVDDESSPAPATPQQPTQQRPKDATDIPHAVDATLAPAPAGKVHEVTIDVSEVVIDGRGRWTFNGGLQGPVLRGRVGDEFRVRFVNHGSMAHSIDFHAGIVSPDQVMRPINPGESLEYNFRAERAGIWLYHCGTMPMSMHVAAGMFGAVIIDPPDLAPVDAEYLLVQSEVYGLTGSAENPVDPAKLAAGTPDAVVFNGMENQYVAHPLQLRAGQTARFWVLDAGPNRSLSFHIVGAQFHTVYHEGAYVLRNGVGGAGGTGGGAQALGLLAAQGGFVEAHFPEAGTYTFVNHQFIDAERGARGQVVVAP
ncbi:multicopper oxidase domain-containing protein [Corynebacterium epidermidicanis]|nr:multicopper oxidase domain-containing protein [Corynebacterium epidermidicanis]